MPATSVHCYRAHTNTTEDKDRGRRQVMRVTTARGRGCRLSGCRRFGVGVTAEGVVGSCLVATSVCTFFRVIRVIQVGDMSYAGR